MKTLITAVLASAFSLGAMAAAHTEKGASAPMGKPMASPVAASAPMASPMAAKSGDMAASGTMTKKAKKAKAKRKAASVPKA
ncbi:MAG: hypothetical protein ABIO71_00465 [Caldimonas sp.]